MRTFGPNNISEPFSICLTSIHSEYPRSRRITYVKRNEEDKVHAREKCFPCEKVPSFSFTQLRYRRGSLIEDCPPFCSDITHKILLNGDNVRPKSQLRRSWTSFDMLRTRAWAMSLEINVF